MPGTPRITPPHHNASRQAMVDAFFAGRLTYVAYPDLASARRRLDALAILDSGDEVSLAAFPVRWIEADEPTLNGLLADLETLRRNLADEPREPGEPRQGRVYYEPPDVVSEYLPRNADGVSLDESLTGLGLESAVEDVLRGRATKLDQAVVERCLLVREWWPAIDGDDVEAARNLLDRNAPIEARNEEGRTALLVASAAGFADLVQLLLDRGADQEARDDGDGPTALALAAANGKLEVVRLLVSRGVDPRRPDALGLTPLDWAQRQGHGDVADYLQDRA